jgi:hypothetical protein
LGAKRRNPSFWAPARGKSPEFTGRYGRACAKLPHPLYDRRVFWAFWEMQAGHQVFCPRAKSNNKTAFSAPPSLAAVKQTPPSP